MGANALGQMALRNAVITDRGIEGRRKASEAATTDQPGGEAGPVQFTLGFSYSIALNDNVNYSEQDAVGDLIQTPAVGLGLAAALTERSRLGFQVGVGYQFYWHDEALSRWQIAPNSELAYDLEAGDVFITLFDRFSYSQDVYNQPGVAGRETFPIFQNIAGTQVSWIPPSDYVLAGGYSYDLSFSGSSGNSYIDRGAHLLFGRVGHLFAQGAINTGLETSATLTDYVDNEVSDTTVISLGPYFEWAVSDSLRMNLRGGYAAYTFTTVSAPDESTDEGTLYLGFSALQQLTEFVSHGLSLVHGVQPGVEENSAFVIETDVGYTVSYNFLDPATFNLGVNYTRGEQEEVVGGLSEEYEQVRLGSSIRWAVSLKLLLTLAYDFYLRDSDRPDRGYTANQVSLGGTYGF